MKIPAVLHDGDLFKTPAGKFVELLDTKGRKGVRITNSVGEGQLYEREDMMFLADLFRQFTSA